jgi:hypothetical protein
MGKMVREMTKNLKKRRRIRMIKRILMSPFRFLGWITGVTQQRRAEEFWLEENGEIPDGHVLAYKFFPGTDGGRLVTPGEYKCVLEKMGR